MEAPGVLAPAPEKTAIAVLDDAAATSSTALEEGRNGLPGPHHLSSRFASGDTKGRGFASSSTEGGVFSHAEPTGTC